jgi:hypothetical protein
VWSYLEKDLGLSQQNVPRNLEAFEMALRNLFRISYNFIESLFRNHLFKANGEKLLEHQCFAEFVCCLGAKSEHALETTTTVYSESQTV